MVYQWEPQVQYNIGAVVEYGGHKYRIIQPHQSLSNWTPPDTPALWSRLPEEGCWEPHPECQPPDFHDGKGPSHSEQERVHQEVPNEEQKKGWHGLDEHRKKELEMGGGLAVGLALLGGGYLAYKGHQKSEEEKKAQIWSLQGWLRDAQARTDEFYQQGGRGNLAWILNKGRHIPENAIVGGHEHGKNLYICRAFHEGGLQVGKASSVFNEGGVIGYKHHEIPFGTYEILVGKPDAVRWVESSGTINVESLKSRGYEPIEGGHEDNGTPLYVVQAPYNNGVHPGKASTGLPSAFIPYDGSEKAVKEYRVAVKA